DLPVALLVGAQPHELLALPADELRELGQGRPRGLDQPLRVAGAGPASRARGPARGRGRAPRPASLPALAGGAVIGGRDGGRPAVALRAETGERLASRQPL